MQILSSSPDYKADNLDAALATFRKARRESTAMLSVTRAADWVRKAIFVEYGEVTLRSHDLQHFACLHWLLAKMA